MKPSALEDLTLPRGWAKGQGSAAHGGIRPGRGRLRAAPALGDRLVCEDGVSSAPGSDIRTPRRSLPQIAAAMAVPLVPARTPRSIACLYCRGRVPIGLIVAEPEWRVLASAVCPHCARGITVARRTLRRLGVPWPVASHATVLAQGAAA
jgi:hypothetical protein